MRNTFLRRLPDSRAMTAICYNRFRIATRSPDNQRRILRWLFRNFMVYDFDVSDATACGRFMVPGPAFPRNAFRELTFSLRGDQTLYIRIISYDLWTLYLEGNVYKYGRWHHITL